MRSLFPSVLLTALALAVLPSVPQTAHAGAGVLRCQMPDGSNVYTNTSCSAFGAKSAPLPGELLNRIERELRHEAAVTGVEPRGPLHAPSRNAGSGSVAAVAGLDRGCADSPQQLAMNLQAAVSLGDVNRLAETYHWNGMRNAQAQRIMVRLAQLASRQMVSVEYFDAAIGSYAGIADAAAGSAVDAETGILQTRVNTGSGTQVLDFSVQRDEGCYFVRY